MDPNKLIEFSNTIYMMIARELSRNGIPATFGRFIVESVYRRISEDALAITAARNNDLESELAKKMQELEELRKQLDIAASSDSTNVEAVGGSK